MNNRERHANLNSCRLQHQLKQLLPTNACMHDFAGCAGARRLLFEDQLLGWAAAATVRDPPRWCRSKCSQQWHRWAAGAAAGGDGRGGLDRGARNGAAFIAKLYQSFNRVLMNVLGAADRRRRRAGPGRPLAGQKARADLLVRQSTSLLCRCCSVCDDLQSRVRLRVVTWRCPNLSLSRTCETLP